MTKTQVHPSWFAAVQMQVLGVCYASQFVRKQWDLATAFTVGPYLSSSGP